MLGGCGVWDVWIWRSIDWSRRQLGAPCRGHMYVPRLARVQPACLPNPGASISPETRQSRAQRGAKSIENRLQCMKSVTRKQQTPLLALHILAGCCCMSKPVWLLQRRTKHHVVQHQSVEQSDQSKRHCFPTSAPRAGVRIPTRHNQSILISRSSSNQLSGIVSNPAEAADGYSSATFLLGYYEGVSGRDISVMMGHAEGPDSLIEAATR